MDSVGQRMYLLPRICDLCMVCAECARVRGAHIFFGSSFINANEICALQSMPFVRCLYAQLFIVDSGISPKPPHHRNMTAIRAREHESNKYTPLWIHLCI